MGDRSKLGLERKPNKSWTANLKVWSCLLERRYWSSWLTRESDSIRWVFCIVEIFPYCNWEDILKVESLVYTWRYFLHQLKPHQDVVHVVVQPVSLGSEGSCIGGGMSMGGGDARAWQLRPFWTIAKKCSGPSFSPVCSRGSRQPCESRIKEHCQRGTAAWDGPEPGSVQVGCVARSGCGFMETQI